MKTSILSITSIIVGTASMAGILGAVAAADYTSFVAAILLTLCVCGLAGSILSFRLAFIRREPFAKFLYRCYLNMQ